MIFYLFWAGLQMLSSSGCKTLPSAENLLQPVMELPNELPECSGMVALGDNTFVALNDSGNKPELYIFNSKGKGEMRVVKVQDVKNHDWEELTSDDQFIYIGDFGNNGGTRQNLMIYKISKSELLSRNEVKPEITTFRYEKQTKFTDSNRHNFDCEAMISKGDSLFLFSKNRGDFRTDLYGIPKVPGNYVTTATGSFDSEGLVTGADYRNRDGNRELVLVGYSIDGKAFYPFILHFQDIKGSALLDGDPHRISIQKVLQTESIVFHDANSVYITNEEEDGTKGFLYEVDLKK